MLKKSFSLALLMLVQSAFGGDGLEVSSDAEHQEVVGQQKSQEPSRMAVYAKNAAIVVGVVAAAVVVVVVAKRLTELYAENVVKNATREVASLEDLAKTGIDGIKAAFVDRSNYPNAVREGLELLVAQSKGLSKDLAWAQKILPADKLEKAALDGVIARLRTTEVSFRKLLVDFYETSLFQKALSKQQIQETVSRIETSLYWLSRRIEVLEIQRRCA